MISLSYVKSFDFFAFDVPPFIDRLPKADGNVLQKHHFKLLIIIMNK